MTRHVSFSEEPARTSPKPFTKAACMESRTAVDVRSILKKSTFPSVEMEKSVTPIPPLSLILRIKGVLQKTQEILSVENSALIEKLTKAQKENLSMEKEDVEKLFEWLDELKSSSMSEELCLSILLAQKTLRDTEKDLFNSQAISSRFSIEEARSSFNDLCFYVAGAAAVGAFFLYRFKLSKS